jgi:hypothetical protein
MTLVKQLIKEYNGSLLLRISNFTLSPTDHSTVLLEGYLGQLFEDCSSETPFYPISIYLYFIIYNIVY